jgi:hypothetical protein
MPIPKKAIPTTPVTRTQTAQDPYTGETVSRQVPRYRSMSAFAILVVLIGIFLLLNAGNLVSMISIPPYKKATVQFNKIPTQPLENLTPLTQLNQGLTQLG